MKKILFLLLCLFLCGCTARSAQLIQPSAVPDRVITKTAIPAETVSGTVSEGDPWESCAASGNTSVSVISAANLNPEEFRRRVQITFMIQDPELSETSIALRCMNGKIYSCRIADGAVCLEQIDVSAEPNRVMKQICEELKDGILSIEELMDQLVPLFGEKAAGK